MALLSMKGSAGLAVALAFFSSLWAQPVVPSHPPPDRVDVGWLAVVRADQGWRVTQVEGLLSPVDGTTPQLRKCNLRPGDQLLSIDGHSLSSLDPLGVAAVLEELPYRDVRIEALRRGDRYLLKPFADRITLESAYQPKFTFDQLPKRDAPAPGFTLRALDGEQLTLSSLRGRWVLLNFWGTWCSGCIQELPALKDLATHHRAELVVVSIAVNDDLVTVRKFAEEKQLPYVVLLGGTLDDPTARAYQVHVAPANVVVDPDGIVRFAGIGPMSLKAAVETVMDGSAARSTIH